MILTYQIYAHLTKVLCIAKYVKRSLPTKEINVEFEQTKCSHGEYLGRECRQCDHEKRIAAHRARIAQISHAAQTDRKGPAAKLRELRTEAQKSPRTRRPKPVQTRVLPPPDLAQVERKKTQKQPRKPPLPKPPEHVETQLVTKPEDTSCLVSDCQDKGRLELEGLCSSCRRYMTNWRIKGEDPEEVDLIPRIRPAQIELFREKFGKDSVKS